MAVKGGTTVTEYKVERQLIPAPEWEEAWLSEDGVIRRQPLIGWAIVDIWMCASFDCPGDMCQHTHEQGGPITLPMVMEDYYAVPYDWEWTSSIVVAKGESDAVLRPWLEQRAEQLKDIKERRAAQSQKGKAS